MCRGSGSTVRRVYVDTSALIDGLGSSSNTVVELDHLGARGLELADCGLARGADLAVDPRVAERR